MDVRDKKVIADCLRELLEICKPLHGDVRIRLNSVISSLSMLIGTPQGGGGLKGMVDKI